MPEALTEQQKELLDRLKSARAKEQSLRDELAALQGLLLELQKEASALLSNHLTPSEQRPDYY